VWVSRIGRRRLLARDGERVVGGAAERLVDRRAVVQLRERGRDERLTIQRDAFVEERLQAVRDEVLEPATVERHRRVVDVRLVPRPGERRLRPAAVAKHALMSGYALRRAVVDLGRPPATTVMGFVLPSDAAPRRLDPLDADSPETRLADVRRFQDVLVEHLGHHRSRSARAGLRPRLSGLSFRPAARDAARPPSRAYATIRN